MENQSSTTKTRETLVNDVNKLKSDTSQLKDNAVQITTDAAQIAQDVRRHANAHVDEARQRFNGTVEAVRETLAAHPLYLIGASFAFGFLFGLRSRR